MPRLLRAFRLAALLVLAVAVLGLPARAEDEEEPTKRASFRTDLDVKTQKDLAAVVSAYLDPAVEFLWRPRKNFITALASLEADKGINALMDIPFLREIVYQGRHFNTRFSDKKWQREEDVTEFKKTGLYMNLVSEAYRFTYTIPKNYPKDRAFAKVPRPEPYPLLLAIHEQADTKDARGQAEKYPGGAVLKRRYPKDEFADLYESWLTLAPVAARAKFLEDGAIRHRYLTGVLTSFWRSYNVDFDRIIVDGTAPAAAIAAAFPHVFAGVVLRPGKAMAFEPEVVRNYATVPVFVVWDKPTARSYYKQIAAIGVTSYLARASAVLEEPMEKPEENPKGSDEDEAKAAALWAKAEAAEKEERAGLGGQLEKAGHPNVTVGSGKELETWLGEQRRQTPKVFKWGMLRPDHQYANWVTITGPDYAASERTMEVEVVDTDEAPNTITLDARGIESVMLFLNDEIVDLDRPIRLVVNGEVKTFQKVERDFGRLFEKEPKVRENMNFGWLFPVLLEDIGVPEPAAEEPPAEEPAETAPEEGPTGSPEDEDRAAKLWAKAEAAEQGGSAVKALTYYKKIVEMGATSYLARATAKVEELE